MAQTAKKMETFVWEGTNQKGERTKGETQASNMALVKANLRKQGINPLKVKKKPKMIKFAGFYPMNIAAHVRNGEPIKKRL